MLAGERDSWIRDEVLLLRLRAVARLAASAPVTCGEKTLGNQRRKQGIHWEAVAVLQMREDGSLDEYSGESGWILYIF